MKITKLVLGILCIILSVLITLQSFFAGIANALESNNEIGGSAGLFVAILMLTGGIVMLVTRKSEHKGGSIASMILFILAFLAGTILAGSYTDLKIWAGFCLIVAVINLLSLFRRQK